ncbi:hypothetical protein GCM10023080_059580 [Streptomyces pseudoechinosporeus]
MPAADAGAAGTAAPMAAAPAAVPAIFSMLRRLISALTASVLRCGVRADAYEFEVAYEFE